MKNLLVISGILLLCAVSFKAQSVYGEDATRDGLRLLEVGKALAQMPEKGTRPEDFVPPHWEITDRAEGDLNADGVKDFAITLMLDEKDEKYLDPLRKLFRDNSWIDQTFILAVIDSRGDGKMHVGGINYELLGDSGAQARHGSERDEFSLAIKKDVLEININYGGMTRWDATFRFRGAGLELIGFDSNVYCSTTTEQCGRIDTSENYLTNTRIETEYQIVRDTIVGKDKKSKIAPVKIQFYQARLNSANGGTQPF